MPSLNTPTMDVLGSNLAITSFERLRDDIHLLVTNEAPGYVCFATAHMMVSATRDAAVREAYRNAALISPDGAPVAWLLRALGARNPQCVSGPRSMVRLFQLASEVDVPVGFYGGRPETLRLMNQRLAREYPTLRVAYSYSPPFRPLGFDEQELDLRRINESGTRLLFVGLGSPRQERWMHDFSPNLKPVCLGVGGAFEFYSGEKHLPPAWLQSLGLTWLIRLLQEPRRLIRRNLYSPIFVYLALRWIAMDEQHRSTWVTKLDQRMTRCEVPGIAKSSPLARARI